MTDKLPAFQFYPGDWRKDMGVQSLSYHDRGIWFEMICLMHESERRGVLVLNGQAMTEEALARMLGLDKQSLSSTITTLLTSGVASREQDSGAIYCRRMVRDENIRKVRSAAGKKGGNPLLLNQKPTTGVKQKSTPSVSSSSSVSSSIEIHPPTPNGGERHVDVEAIAVSVMQGCGFTDKRLVPVIVAQLCSAADRGDPPQTAALAMQDAWRKLKKQRHLLRYDWGPKKFISEGHWRDDAAWPWDHRVLEQRGPM